MRALDVGHRPGMQIEPFLTEDGVPSPADELMHHDKNPNCEMIDLPVHKGPRSIIRWLELQSQADSSQSSQVDLTRVGNVFQVVIPRS